MGKPFAEFESISPKITGIELDTSSDVTKGPVLERHGTVRYNEHSLQAPFFAGAAVGQTATGAKETRDPTPAPNLDLLKMLEKSPKKDGCNGSN